MLYYSYNTLAVSNPYDYLGATAIAFSMDNNQLYDFIGTLEVLTE